MGKDDLSKTGAIKDARRCTAHRKNGERCKRAAILGGTVCTSHGGGARHVREKAQRRMLAMVAPALARLDGIIRSPETSDADAVRAVREVFNRAHAAGLTEKAGLDVTVEASPWDNLILDVGKALQSEQDEPMPKWVTLGAMRYKLAEVIDLAYHQAGSTPPLFDPADVEAQPVHSDDSDVIDAEIVEELDPPRRVESRLPVPVAGSGVMPAYLAERLAGDRWE